MSLLRRSSTVVLTASFAMSVLFASVSAAVAAGPAASTAAAEDPTAVDAAEQRVIELINERRDRKGLRPLRLDPRVAKIARARSQDMVERHYFSHEDPDGKYARQHLQRAGIRFSRVSEIIAFDRGHDLVAEAEDVVQMWMDSPVHHHEIMSRTHNYLGAGVATDGRTIKWTVISITGPDRTDPIARITSIVLAGDSATVQWRGSDPRLVVGTAGIRDYDLSRRQPGGSWQTVRDDTTRVSTVSAAREGTEYRVRARDKAGNTGAWSAVVAASSMESGE